MLIESNGKVPGLPGRSSFVDVRDLATAFVAAAHNGEGRGECYIIGGTNASNLEMLQEMARIVGVPPPQHVTPRPLLQALACWNELVLKLPLLHRLRIMPKKIQNPWLMAKAMQEMSTESLLARVVLGYRPRPLADMLRANYDWLAKAGKLHVKS